MTGEGEKGSVKGISKVLNIFKGIIKKATSKFTKKKDTEKEEEQVGETAENQKNQKEETKEEENVLKKHLTKDLVKVLNWKSFLIIATFVALIFLGVFRFNIISSVTTIAILSILGILLFFKEPKIRRFLFTILLSVLIWFSTIPFWLPYFGWGIGWFIFLPLITSTLLIFFEQEYKKTFIITSIVLSVVLILFLAGWSPISGLFPKLSGKQVGSNAYGASFTKKTERSFKTLNEAWKERLKLTKEVVDMQLKCAMGECPEGEAQGPRVGLMVSSPQPFVDKKYFVGDTISFYSYVEGLNLDLYPKQFIATECSINNQPLKPTPEEIPFTDVSNYQRIVRCSGKILDDKDFINKLNVSVRFNFTTESELTLYIMNAETRDSMMQAFGPNFLYDIFRIQNAQVAKFNDGPINLGIATPETIIAVDDNQDTTDLYFALTNQWLGLNGFVNKIKSITIELPAGMSLTDFNDEYCPFKEQGDGVYVLNSEINEPIRLLRNFVCTLKIKKENTGNHPIWMPIIKISASYEYKIMRSTTIDIYKKKQKTKTQEEIETPEDEEQQVPSGNAWVWPTGTWKFSDGTLAYAVYNCYGDGWSFHRGFHSGMDIEAEGDEEHTALIYAVDDGVVEKVVDGCEECDCSKEPLLSCCYCKGTAYGNYVKIKHDKKVNGKTIETVYSHLYKNSILVSENEHVSKGDVIGTMGSSGYSTDVHLHFEVWADGNLENPINYFDESQLNYKVLMNNPACIEDNAFYVCTNPREDVCPEK